MEDDTSGRTALRLPIVRQGFLAQTNASEGRGYFPSQHATSGVTGRRARSRRRWSAGGRCSCVSPPRAQARGRGDELHRAFIRIQERCGRPHPCGIIVILGAVMANVLIRDLDEKVLKRLKATARANGRSLQAEIHDALSKASTRSLVETRRLSARWLKRLRGPHSDSVALIREDRDRR